MGHEGPAWTGNAMNVRVLVTGGNGYFGSLLVNHLVESSSAVRVLDVDPSAHPFDEQGTRIFAATVIDGPTASSAPRHR